MQIIQVYKTVFARLDSVFWSTQANSPPALRWQVMFSFEAGRRCDSGPGNFTFETKQGNDIFTLVDQAIQSQKAQAEERRLSCPLGLEPDGCPSSLQHLRGAASSSATVASGDSSGSCGSWDDADSGGSKPGSADGVLGWREGGPAGGLKGRSLPEPPPAPGGGASSRGQGGAGKGPPSADEQAGVYSEPVDSVRLPHPVVSDCLYADPVDSIKAQSAAAAPPPMPNPRLRPVGGEAAGGDQHHQPQHGRKPQDLYSHVYDLITLDLKQKTSLNGGGGGVGGRWANRTWQPPGGPPAAEEGAAPEHIYDEPEGCAAKGTLGGRTHNPASSSPARVAPQPPKWAKPLTAPKPARSALARKEPPGKQGGGGGGGGCSNNNNNNNEVGGVEGGDSSELYSKVSKQKVAPTAGLWFSPKQQPPLRSPDIIYDNLGHI